MGTNDKEAAPKKQRNARQIAARRKAIRERLSKRPAGFTRPAHAEKIATFHALEKQLAKATGAERMELLRKQQDLGGLEEYQSASKTGAKNGESSKWLVRELEKLRGRKNTKLLDVGAIDGQAYKKYKSFDPTYIDLNPQAAHVQQADFLEYPVPAQAYDVVCLSLVLNFVGDLEKRTQMLLRPHKFMKSDGYLYLVLPLACLANSRYMDHGRLTGILETLGWKVAVQDDTAMLTHWLLQPCPRNSKTWPRTEVRPGVKRNNFVVIVK